MSTKTAAFERAIRAQAEALRRADEMALHRVAQERRAKTERWLRLLGPTQPRKAP